MYPVNLFKNIEKKYQLDFIQKNHICNIFISNYYSVCILLKTIVFLIICVNNTFEINK